MKIITAREARVNVMYESVFESYTPLNKNLGSKMLVKFNWRLIYMTIESCSLVAVNYLINFETSFFDKIIEQ